MITDQSAIEALNSSKTISDDIKEKQEIADKTEIEIDKIRMQYVPAAFRGSLLYFCIASLASIEPTYQYSLTWFSNLFVKGCTYISDAVSKCNYRHSDFYELIPLLMSSIESYLSNKPKQCILKN